MKLMRLWVALRTVGSTLLRFRSVGMAAALGHGTGILRVRSGRCWGAAVQVQDARCGAGVKADDDDFRRIPIEAPKLVHILQELETTIEVRGRLP